MNTKKILVIGNCHAQYLGAALKALTNHDVRVAGKLFEGPVHFRGTLPDMLLLQPAIEWWKDCAPENRVLLMQTTPALRYSLSDSLRQRGIEHACIRFPYLRFTAFDLKTLPEGEAGDRVAKRAIRTDRVFNELSIHHSDIPDEFLATIMEGFKATPSSYKDNHFTGNIYGSVLRGIGAAKFSALFSEEDFERVVSEIERDQGIGHIYSGAPAPRVCELLGIQWKLPELWTARIDQIMQAPNAYFVASAPCEDMNGILRFMVVRTAGDIHRKTSSKAHLALCLRIYRGARNLAWTRMIIEALLREKKPLLATVILLNRMRWDDARGSVFVVGLSRAQDFARSKGARSLIAAAARNAPGSNVCLLSQALDRIG